MAPGAIIRATADDAERCAAALLLAFSNDPFVRWMFPEPERYLTYFGALTRFLAAKSIESGSSYLPEDARAAAVWLPPHASVDRSPVEAIMQAGIADERKDEVLGMLSLMRGHHPEETHWYLQFLGADPARQGMGYGTVLLEQSLKTVDEEHLPAFLVSSNPRNQTLYERFGFQVTATVQAGSAPAVRPMYRPAR
jgi:ribosomal protein S18 acetylase RimI-like enzyme